MNEYVVAVAIVIPAVFLIAFAITCGLRFCHRRKRQEIDEEQTTPNVVYPEGVSQRGDYEPYYTVPNTVEEAQRRDARGDRYYFNFQDLEAHPFHRTRQPVDGLGPVMAVDAQGSQMYQSEPYVGTLVFDGDVVRGRRRRRAREPIHYGEAVYVAHGDTAARPHAQEERK